MLAPAMTHQATRSWPIHVLSLGAASAGAVAWRRSGKLHVSPILKATFQLVHGADMRPTLPEPLCTVERPHADAPERSVLVPLDTAPTLPRADVLFAGHAHAPAGAPAPRVSVRLSVRAANGELLLDKPLEVLGDRLLLPGRPPPEPAPFTRIPMIYERAYGSPDYRANPVGMGAVAELAGRRRMPNIVHPTRSPRPAVEPAGFALISHRWPVRERMLRATSRHVLEQPIAEIPASLDPVYFQAAPADQQTRYLHGDEWIVLHGLHPRHPTLEARLPGARGVARIYLPDGSSQPVPLVADMLFIDGDAEQCSVTWRGSFPVASEADLPGMGIVAGVELPGQPVAFPPRFPRAAAPDQDPAALRGRQGTVVISTDESDDDDDNQMGTLRLDQLTPPRQKTTVMDPPSPGRQRTTVMAPVSNDPRRQKP